jgi:hypothetical protein
MKRYMSALAAVVALSACNKVSEKAPQPAPVVQTKAGPAILEVRDFTISKERDNSHTTYNGRGTILSRDPQLSTGYAELWMTVKEDYAGGEVQKRVVLLKDGIGTVTTYESIRNEKEVTVKYSDWTAIGYAPLIPADIVKEGQPATSNGKNVPLFELRDFSVAVGKDENGMKGSFGRGTLVTKDERLKKGKFRVFLSAKAVHENDEDVKEEVYLDDGIGTITTFAATEEKAKAGYRDWHVLGYIPLKTGVVVADNAQVGAEVKNVARFEVRDFRLEKSKQIPMFWSYTGRGTLVALDDAVRNAPHVVYFSYTRKEDGYKQTNVVVMRDGVASINIHDLIWKEANLSDVTISNWEIVGFAPLMPATVATPSTQ